MPSYRFYLTNAAEVRQAGIINSDSFSAAMDTINEHVTAREGDTLEIGVPGFPPARYECVWSGPGATPTWRPASRELAA